MSVAIILPARLASTRLPRKLLLDRTGRTVLEHTVARAFEAQSRSEGLITRVLVAADDPCLIEVARRAGAEAVLTDPHHTSGTDRIAEAAANISDEIIVNLQADEPEMDASNVLQVARLLAAPGESAPMATLAVPIFDESNWLKPNVVKVVADHLGRALYFSRAPIPHLRDSADANTWTLDGRRVFGLHHLGIYAYRRAFLMGYKNLPTSRLEQMEKLEQLRAVEAGHTIKLGVTRHHPPGIDTPEDYEAFVKRWSASAKK